MHIVKEVAALRALVGQWRQAGLTIGFVPTMGNLHAGHLSLVTLAQTRCDKVVVSVFVNPLQFGPNEDFSAYPRTFAQDEQALQSVNADVLFYPAVSEIYPSGMQQTVVHAPSRLSCVLEGASRVGHFDGVTTVVNKLFNIVQPDMAVFGQKDYQQLRVIQTMVADLAMPIEILTGSIARDEDGLALSSRNQYLSPEQRAIAPKLNTVLQDIDMALRAGNDDYVALCATASAQLLAEGFDAVDYIVVCDAQTLEVVESSDRPGSVLPSHQSKVILAVARLGKTRLLDNVLV